MLDFLWAWQLGRRIDLKIFQVLRHEHLKYPCLSLIYIELDALHSLFEGRADAQSTKNEVVERLGEFDGSLIHHVLLVLNADHVLGSALKHDFADEVRSASGNQNYIKVIMTLIWVTDEFT